MRIATRSLSTAADAPSTAVELEGIAQGLGIGFLNAGATSSLEHVTPGGAIAQLIKHTSFTSCSFAWQKASLTLFLPTAAVSSLKGCSNVLLCLSLELSVCYGLGGGENIDKLKITLALR